MTRHARDRGARKHDHPEVPFVDPPSEDVDSQSEPVPLEPQHSPESATRSVAAVGTYRSL